MLALAAAATAAAPGLLPSSSRHTVVRGDTLWDLARANGTTIAAIKSLNGLAGDTIYAGALLLLPGAGSTGSTSGTAAASAASSYVVRPGDTLTGIAARAGVTQTEVRALNPLPADGTVLIGQRLRLPGATGTAVAPAPSAVASGYSAAVARSRSRLTASTSSDRASARELVRSEAVRQGVDPRLALAVAYQESGFSQGVVSRTDAVGVMQLMQDTAVWVGPALLGRQLDRYDVRDNVAGGVALLRALLQVVDTPTAVASYYQGLARTRATGLLPETRLYVTSVLALRSRLR